MALNIFAPSVSGMEAYSHGVSQISTNIANMNTIGYKSNETLFYSLFGSQPLVKSGQSGLSSSRVDVNGVGFYDRTNVDAQGVVTASNRSYDVAINGTGNAFFSVKDRFSGDVYYTRAGNFGTNTFGGQTYLVNSGGLRVQGFPALDGGGFGGAPEDIVIKYPEKIPSTPTTKASITANVPATGVDTSNYGITVYGPNNDGKTMNMLFTKVEGQNNAWNVTFSIDGGTVDAPPIEARFDANGALISPKTFDVAVNWEDGSSNNIAMDISNMTQLAGSSGVVNVEQDGQQGGNFINAFIGPEGIVQASYTNGKTFNIAKLALSSFPSPDNLIPISGTLFEANGSSGQPDYLDNNKDYIQPQALEQSTATAEKEFGQIILMQRAYTSNANTFTVNDEMLQTAVNLKA